MLVPGSSLAIGESSDVMTGGSIKKMIFSSPK